MLTIRRNSIINKGDGNQSTQSGNIDLSGTIKLGDALRNSKQPQALVSFVLDDGLTSAYTLAYPLFVEQGEVGVLAVITDDAGTAGNVTWAQAKEMQAGGWEIASHTKTHTDLTTYNEAQLRTEFDGTAAAFAAQGITAKNLVYPLYQNNALVRKVAAEYYRSAAAGGARANTIESGVNGFPLDTYCLIRSTYDNGSLAAFQTLVDEAYQDKKWLIVCLHAFDATTVTEIGTLIDYIQAYSIPIVTLDEGLDLVGNIVDSGDAVSIGNGFRSWGTETLVQDGSASTGTDETIDNAYEAFKFTAASSFHCGSAQIKLKLSALPTNSSDYVDVYLYSNNAGVPGTALTAATRLHYQYIQAVNYVVPMEILIDYPLVSGTSYWIVLKYYSIPVAATLSIDGTNTGTGLWAISANGTAWTAQDSKTGWFKLYSRAIYGADIYSNNNYGLFAKSLSNYGIYAKSDTSYGLYAKSRSREAIYAISEAGTAITATSSYLYGVNATGLVAGIYGNSGTGIGIRASSSSGAGLQSTSVSGTGLIASSTEGVGLASDSTQEKAARFTINPATTNSLDAVMSVRRHTSGTADAGIGGSIDFSVEDGGGTSDLAGRIGVLYTNATHTSEESSIAFYARTGGAVAAEVARINGNGVINVNEVSGGSGNFKAATTTVTCAVGASVTASNLIPDGAVVYGVTTRVITQLGASTGTNGYQVGDGSDPDRWGSVTGIIVGTDTDNTDWTVTTVQCFTAANNVVLTANGGNFDGAGVIRITVFYFDCTAPTA